MQISLETIEGLQRRMTVELPADDLEAGVKRRLQSLAKTTKMAGFRPGKVPMKVIESRYGPQARQEAIGELVQSSLYQALSQEKLRVAGQPNIEVLPAEAGHGPKYAATFEVYPEIEIADMAGITLEVPSAEITDEDIENTVNMIRQQNVSYSPVERASEEGDKMVIDFVGTQDGVAFEGGTANDVSLTLGAKQFIEDFEKALYGLKAGDRTDFDASFPEDYQSKDLAGKTTHFDVTVKTVEAPQLPEINEEFAAKFGIAEGGVEALYKEVRENMQRELDQTIKNVVKNQVMDALVEKHNIALPQAIVQEEIQRLKQSMQQNMGGQAQLAELPDDLFKEQAERRVRLGLIMSEIVQKDQLKPDPVRIKAAIDVVAASYDDPQQVHAYYQNNAQARAEMEAMDVEDQVVDNIKQNADIKDKKSTFDELVRPPKK
jgi:trigger factor